MVLLSIMLSGVETREKKNAGKEAVFEIRFCFSTGADRPDGGRGSSPQMSLLSLQQGRCETLYRAQYRRCPTINQKIAPEVSAAE
jgi:hypothetical protein